MTSYFRTSLLVFFAFLGASACAQEAPQAIKDALKRADDAIAAIIAVPDGKRTFDNTVGALDDLTTRLDTDTSVFIFMQNVSPDAKVREQARAADELVSNWSIDVGKREDLFKAIKAYADTKPTIEGEQRRLLEFTMRDYHLSGMDLPIDQREKLKDIEKQINKIQIDFEQNIADDETVVPLTLADLKGIPKDIVSRQVNSNGIYLVKPDESSYGRMMSTSLIPETRHKLWLAFRRRVPQNVHVLEQLIKLRDEEAHLLGFKNSVDLVLATRMAKNSETVAKFYKDLEPIVKRKAVLDKAEFDKAKQAYTKDPKARLEPWDYGFFNDQLLKKKYAVDEEKVAEYFPVDKVFKGFFEITSRLYGIEYRDITSEAPKLGMPIWHPDVKLWGVYDKKSGELIGRVFTDLYPRPGKYTHAACWGLQERKVWQDGSVQLPLAALVCNFTKPTADKPALMHHDEVETFFHEFGHGLHNLLTLTKYGRFSGAIGVERDFVEAPSQMMENWVWEPEVLNLFARHYKTGKPIPVKMLEGMRAARTLGSGMDAEGQLYLGEMDQAFHTAANGEVDTTKVAQAIYARETEYKAQPGNLFQASFGHMVGYNGAYYGYLWSLVYAQDMFQRFKQLGLLSPSTGEYYRSKILAQGGSLDAMDMLKDYLGRPPKTDAFYAHLGLKPGK